MFATAIKFNAPTERKLKESIVSANSRHHPKVLLLHGWGGSYEKVWKSTGFVSQLEEAGLEPVAVDLPGHGHAQGSYDPADYSDLAGEVLLGLPDSVPIYGIGYSLGAKIILEIERRSPGRFSRLILAGVGGNAFAPEKLGHVVASALEEGVTSDTPAGVRALVEYGIAAGNDARSIAACLRRQPNPVLSPAAVANVKCPTLLVCGSQDSIALPLEPLADALPRCSLKVLTDIDHLHLPESDDFRNAALAFLAA
ncbi:alpha/beta fold hydrolase [Paraburkholderia sp. SIMBA_030]|uniref:alpha/beta fold hydrolase n=1 Tax=Paraburkholderia sp. SIMBA_030 TaxID=3085773 RepID=UPI00397A642D